MSKAETSLDDAKKLAQRVKALEAQLRQTISKKEHHEIVLEFEDKLTAMEKKVSSQDRKVSEQDKELAQAKAELQRSANLGRQLADVGAQVAALARTAEAQAKTAEALLFKVSQGTVPAAVHQQSLSKVKELEERMGGMVNKADFTSLQRRYDEATRQLDGTVPSSEYEALKGRVQELEGEVSAMVPREQLDSSEALVRELKARLSEHVPQSTYDELVSRVVQLAEEVTGGQPRVEELEIVARQEEPEPEEPRSAEPRPTVQPEIPRAPTPVTVEAAAEAAPAARPEVPAEVAAETPEINEVQAQLAELKTEAVVDSEPEAGPPSREAPALMPHSDEVEMSDPKFVVTIGTPESDGQETQG